MKWQFREKINKSSDSLCKSSTVNIYSWYQSRKKIIIYSRLFLRPPLIGRWEINNPLNLPPHQCQLLIWIFKTNIQTFNNSTDFFPPIKQNFVGQTSREQIRLEWNQTTSNVIWRLGFVTSASLTLYFRKTDFPLICTIAHCTLLIWLWSWK